MTLRIFSFLLGLLGLAAATAKVFEQPAYASQAHVSYYGDGHLKERTHFLEGQRHGHTLRWHADGTLKAEGDFEHGKMQGQWTWRTPAGELDEVRSGVYEDGVRISG
jgi:hypothetical protein